MAIELFFSNSFKFIIAFIIIFIIVINLALFFFGRNCGFISDGNIINISAFIIIYFYIFIFNFRIFIFNFIILIFIFRFYNSFF